MRWASFFFFVPFHASPPLILWQCQIHAFQISARPRSPAAHSPTLRLVLVPPLPFFFFFLRPFSLWIFLSFNLNAFSLHRHLLLLFSSQFFCFNFYYSFSFVFLYQQRTKICYESDPSFFNSKKRKENAGHAPRCFILHRGRQMPYGYRKLYERLFGHDRIINR